MPKKASEGDFYEVSHGTEGKLVYFQLCHKKKGGYVVWAIHKIYNERPSINQLSDATNSDGFYCMISLLNLLKANQVTCIGNKHPIDKLCKFPVFKNGMSFHGEVIKRWWLWDGNNDTEYLGEIAEIKSYPLKQIISLDILTNRVLRKWTPELCHVDPKELY